MNPLIFTGLAVGLLFGFALQRGRFCMNSAFRDILLVKDFTLIKAVAVALLVEMAGFAVLALTGTITLNPKPLLWGANMVGGFVFGAGMVVAGGCASGITYRIGEGMVGAMSALVGFAFAGLMATTGVLKPVVETLQTTTKVMTADGKSLTLANWLGIPYNVLAFGIPVLALIVWVVLAMRNKEEEDDFGSAKSYTLTQRIFKRGWGWLATGIVIGLIGIIAFPASAAAGRNYPLGITGGHVSFVKTLFTGENALNWEVMLVIGVILGAAIAAWIAGEFKLRAPTPGILIQTFVGGLLMGGGAVLAGGCNVGHILSGVPQLSLGSILSGIFIILGGWATSYLMFMLPSKPTPAGKKVATPAPAGR